jgi:hypothetical protein
MTVTARLKWEPRDLWVGLYWNRSYDPTVGGGFVVTEFFICLIPMIPLHTIVHRPWRESDLPAWRAWRAKHS